MEEKTVPMRVSRYHVPRILKFVGVNKPFLNPTQLFDRALDNLLTKLEEKVTKRK